ncbi:MAG: hypothetical protein O3C28_20250 [Proteobacteria bacterium]|nr:hypothetical protein [Pseudomonadota bacterium]
MSHSLLDDPRLPDFLCSVDGELASEAQAAGCPHCGGVLHSARYARSVRGGGTDAINDYRASFCCAQDGCRRRITPPSVRFAGRKRFPSPVVLLVSAARHGARPAQARALERTYGISRSTLARWQRWWREKVPGTAFWRMARTQFISPVDPTCMATQRVERFNATTTLDNLVAALRSLAPVHDIRGHA